MANQDFLNPLRVYVEFTAEDPHRMFDKIVGLMTRTHRVLSVGFLPDSFGPRRRLFVPALQGFGHLALFFDERAVIECGLADLLDQAKDDPHRAVYVPEQEASSPWPSLLLFRTKYCEQLTPAWIPYAQAEQLAPVYWAGGSQNVGTLKGIRVDLSQMAFQL